MTYPLGKMFLDLILLLDSIVVKFWLKNIKHFCVFYEEVTYYYSFVKSYTNFFYIRSSLEKYFQALKECIEKFPKNGEKKILALNPPL